MNCIETLPKANPETTLEHVDAGTCVLINGAGLCIVTSGCPIDSKRIEVVSLRYGQQHFIYGNAVVRIVNAEVHHEPLT